MRVRADRAPDFRVCARDIQKLGQFFGDAAANRHHAVDILCKGFLRYFKRVAAFEAWVIEMAVRIDPHYVPPL